MNLATDKHIIRVGITGGDINGVGMEVIIKALSEELTLESFTPVVYSSSKVFSYYKKVMDVPLLNFNTIPSADNAVKNKINLINCWTEEVQIQPGISTAQGAQCAYAALEKATDDLKNGKIDVLVTAPIDKSHMKEAGFDFPGHTEYLMKRASGESLMIMAHDNLRVALVTGHIAIANVPKNIQKDKILHKIATFNQALKNDFNVSKPKIAVLALNPHASDGGKFGNEEALQIIPAIQEANEKNMLCFGPFSADGFFASNNFMKYDGILAMYHDQGLIPFKTLAAQGGVNYTAGLDIVRTSPDHGVAYDIAGKNKANAVSMIEAIRMAMDIYVTRKNIKEYKKNPLKNLSHSTADRER